MNYEHISIIHENYIYEQSGVNVWHLLTIGNVSLSVLYICVCWLKNQWAPSHHAGNPIENTQPRIHNCTICCGDWLLGSNRVNGAENQVIIYVLYIQTMV